MIRNYFNITIRSLRKNPVYAAINVAGLSLGMAAFILIFQYITYEKSVNAFHINLPNLYRMLYEVSFSGKTMTWTSLPPALGPMAKEQFSEVEESCRVMSGSGNGIVSNEEASKSLREENVAYADGNFFRVFTFSTDAGNAAQLKNPNTVAISSAMAEKYFAKENPIGKILTLNNQFGKTLYTVVSVYPPFPVNSDLDYDLVFSLETLANPANLDGSEWANLTSFKTQFIETYLLTKPGIDYRALETKINEAKQKAVPEATEIARLQPMSATHIPSSLSDYYVTSGNLKFLYILEGIAVLILVIAWFNYINLATASALKRAKEVGIRKVVGASRKQLIRQFLGESILLNTAGLMIALALVNLVQGIYNDIIGKDLSLAIFSENKFWIVGFVMLIIGSFASGGYTAFALSSFTPSQTLKGIFSNSVKGIFLRKSLVVFQFSISILLIASTIILYRQLEYMQNEDLGMNLHQLVSLREPEVGKDSTFAKRTQLFLNDLSQQSFVEDYAMSGSVPGNWYNYSGDGITRLNPQAGDDNINYSFTYVDHRFFPIFSIPIVAGKNFTEEMSRTRYQQNDKVIINEYASRLLGFNSNEDAIGQHVLYGKTQLEVVGVVKDYHHLSLQRSVDPVIFFPSRHTKYFTIKLPTDNIQAHMAELENLYKKNFPGNPFEYFFVDEKYNKQYQTEQQYGAIFSTASALAIFIACLGLFGLATFTVEQRVKEIGIRKVLGANVSQITTLLSKDFLKLVLIALIIATPLSWYVMEQWLNEFAYRTQISSWIFVAAGGLAILIAIVTVSSQAIKAALTNPVRSLKNE